MNFIFECSTRYLTRSLRSLVRSRVEHEKIKFISTSGHGIFCLLHKHANDDDVIKLSALKIDVARGAFHYAKLTGQRSVGIPE